jgi:uracil-DNA glycosylase family 4
MGEVDVDPKQEFKGIIDQLVHLLNDGREMGLDPPSLSPATLEYLDAGSSQPKSLDDLKAFIGDCKRCKLSHGRTHLVFGEGASQARLVFVGEGPGREEDLEGRPFVGEAGKLLTRIIEAMGLTREEVYICNVVKCRPSHNRDPEQDEIHACLPFLRQQLSIIRPRVICALGRIAAQGLLGREVKITRERGKWESFMGIPLMPTFHPAYIVRNPATERELKGRVWEDVQEIMKLMELEVKRHG